MTPIDGAKHHWQWVLSQGPNMRSAYDLEVMRKFVEGAYLAGARESGMAAPEVREDCPVCGNEVGRLVRENQVLRDTLGGKMSFKNAQAILGPMVLVPKSQLDRPAPSMESVTPNKYSPTNSRWWEGLWITRFFRR